MKNTMITILDSKKLDIEVIESLDACQIAYNVYLTNMSIEKTKAAIYGTNSMLAVVVSKLDKQCYEILNANKYIL